MALSKQGYDDAQTGTTVAPVYVDSDGKIATSTVDIAGVKKVSIQGSAAENSAAVNEDVLTAFMDVVNASIVSGRSGMSVKWGET